MIKRDEKKEAKKFAIALAVIGAAGGGYFFWKESLTVAYSFFGVGGVALLLGFLVPGLWMIIFRKWMKFAELLSWVMTRVILSVFYFFILTPVGLAMRVLGKRPLDVKFRDGKPTYWVDKEPGEFTIDRYRKQW